MFKTIEQRVLKHIDENHLIEKNDKILIALSGGADSVFLFHSLLKFKQRLGLQFSAFHLNHKIRGREALEDEKFCRNICNKNKIEIFIVGKNVKSYANKKRLSVEEAGRKLRYEELNRIADINSFNKIATAHNASDNAETVLLNLIKGAGVKGLSGIPVRRDNIIRPLLNLTSEEIRDYLAGKKIRFRFDKTNLETEYERNFIRNEIVPRLKKLNPKAEEKILNSSKIVKGLRASVEKLVESAIEKSVQTLKNGLKINLKKLLQLDKNLWNELFKSVIDRKFNIELTNENLKDISKLAQNQSGRKLILANKISAQREREFIILETGTQISKENFQIKIKTGDSANINAHTFQIKKVKSGKVKKTSKKNTERISADKLKSVFEVRNWRDGDRFYPLGMDGSKKISDFLTDEKISSSEKKKQLVLTNDGKIVWVVGLRIDNRFKVTSKTQTVIELSYK